MVRYLAEDCGIRQFIDNGSGLPTQDNVHQIAQRLDPDSRVVYIDSDPIVVRGEEQADRWFVFGGVARKPA